MKLDDSKSHSRNRRHIREHSACLVSRFHNDLDKNHNTLHTSVPSWMYPLSNPRNNLNCCFCTHSNYLKLSKFICDRSLREQLFLANFVKNLSHSFSSARLHSIEFYFPIFQSDSFSFQSKHENCIARRQSVN